MARPPGDGRTAWAIGSAAVLAVLVPVFISPASSLSRGNLETSILKAAECGATFLSKGVWSFQLLFESLAE